LRDLKDAKGITGAMMFDANGDRKNIPYQIYSYDEKGELSPYSL